MVKLLKLWINIHLIIIFSFSEIKRLPFLPSNFNLFKFKWMLGPSIIGLLNITRYLGLQTLKWDYCERWDRAWVVSLAHELRMIRYCKDVSFSQRRKNETIYTYTCTHVFAGAAYVRHSKYQHHHHCIWIRERRSFSNSKCRRLVSIFLRHIFCFSTSFLSL